MRQTFYILIPTVALTNLTAFRGVTEAFIQRSDITSKAKLCQEFRMTVGFLMFSGNENPG